ncbi:uncharacterized protein HMPREF1541_08319 [Cyphellophora europaea CBS 101466]|uniref:Uncharacterized protein n=1 Tax=Cyphellophora europaea (strain CBS 101466) TaxID=1220924 RepID=W2RNQ6_CYPE1|nr:uncharacterized protein HMPREF1541_08319 [Cyphellophora europaea CBS 101466]ETN37328.1 hypothetical protein HMPREF1541_08319 [Cyphellophora europaea CBS 101466]
MKTAAFALSALALAASASAATINKARSAQSDGSYAPAPSGSSPPTPAQGQPQQGQSDSSSVPSYYLDFTTQQLGADSQYSDASGTIDVSISGGDVLISVAVVNPADNAACFVRDAQGNQIRAFGGPDQDVDSVQFVEADGKQARSIHCQPA